ncbi:MAG TPA: polymer-forming cytoskeletal protein [Alphaproteobacteria bacterium]|nr:polymer-forming cytoskeletal protein [Alphaproteobacteria bacterium]
MFSRTNKGNGMSTSSSGKGMPSIISQNFRVVGNITSEGDVQLDGTVDGNLKAKSLVIGPTGAIRGEVKADKVQVQGSVTGPIRARTVEIAKTAKLAGDVFYEQLTVETGAVIDGSCKRWDADKGEVKPVETKPVAPATPATPAARTSATPSATAA